MIFANRSTGIFGVLLCMAACASDEPADSESSARDSQRAESEMSEFVSGATPQQVAGKAPGDTSQTFEIIRDEQHLQDVLAAMEIEGNAQVSSNGSPWQPEIDFERAVVGWFSLGFRPSCWEGVTAVTTRTTSGGVAVEFSVGAEGCVKLDAECYPYALTELPKSDLPYAFTVKDELPFCNSSSNER